jgi:hypothetical protein
VGYVYVLRSGESDHFKVGRTERNVADRVKQLSTGNPSPLIIFDVIETPYAAKCETFLLNRLQPRRSRDSGAKEFFVIEPDEMRVEVRLARDYAENDLPKVTQVQALALVACEDRWVSPSEQARSIFRELIEVRASIDILTRRREKLENDLKLTIGTAIGLEGLATWKFVEGHRFNTDQFAKDHPELYLTYYIRTRTRMFRLL